MISCPNNSHGTVIPISISCYASPYDMIGRLNRYINNRLIVDRQIDGR